jgi:hypothetical protein
VEFGDADGQRFARFLDHLGNRELEAIGVAFFAGEGAELAAEDAVVRVVDVAIEDVGGVVSAFAGADEIGDRTDGVEVFAVEKAEGVVFGNALAFDDFVVEIAEFAVAEGKVHAVASRKEWRIDRTFFAGRVVLDRAVKQITRPQKLCQIPEVSVGMECAS